MVAYSFQKMFADPILIDRKRHTVRAHPSAAGQHDLHRAHGSRRHACRVTPIPLYQTLVTCYGTVSD